ncbi:MAG: DUF1254 domain-containing protein [Amphritea sp.]
MFLNKSVLSVSILAAALTLTLPAGAASEKQAAKSVAQAAVAPNFSAIAAQDEIAKENWAYSIGIQAYVYGLPLAIFDRERVRRLNPKMLERIKHLCPCAPINQIGHMNKLATSQDQLPYTPNNDTVYSGVAVELKDEPLIFSAPDIEDRYWSVQITDTYFDNFLYLGSRATDGKGGHHAFVGPDWQGELPDDVIVHRAPTNSILIAVRIGVLPDNPADLAVVNKLQHQFHTTSLSNWGSEEGFGKANAPQMKRKTYSGELAFYEKFADLLAENPPTADHAAALAPFKSIGIELGKPFDAQSLDEATRRGMARALKDGKEIMRWKVKYRGTAYPTRWNNLHEGSYGYHYINRAEGALEGLIVHDREEAVYFSTYEDGEARLLDASRNYRLHFDKDQLPPVEGKGFWSLTMYGTDFQLVDNAINRYAIGDRSKGLKYNPDGSLDVYVQHEPPKGHESNWLPTAAQGLFRINYRIYTPGPSAINPDTLQQHLPPLKRIESQVVSGSYAG